MSGNHETGDSIQPPGAVSGPPPMPPPLPPPSQPPNVAVPWNGLAIVLVWLLDNLGLTLVAGLLMGIQYLRLLYGPEWKEQLGSAAMTWLGLWATGISLPLRLLMGILAICHLCEARPAQMGLTTERLLSRAAQGVGLALVLAIGVYGVQQGCEAVLRTLSGRPVEEHPLTLLARQGLSPLEWTILIFVAVVAAPIWEEFFFRGLIQPWAITRPWGGPVLLALVPVLVVVLRYDLLLSAIRAGGTTLILELLPVVVALGLMPIYVVLKLVFRSPVPAGIFATAMLFGWFHARVWPSPIPLTLLGVGLGWLCWRTRSLAGPIALHTTFNSIAIVVLVVEGWLKVGS